MQSCNSFAGEHPGSSSMQLTRERSALAIRTKRRWPEQQSCEPRRGVCQLVLRLELRRQRAVGSRSCTEQEVNLKVPKSDGHAVGWAQGFCRLAKTVLGRRLAKPVGQVASTHEKTFQGSMGRMASSLSSSKRRSPNEGLPNPFVSAETLKACALIGLHLLAAEGEYGLSGSQSRDLGDMWRYGCPKSPDWDGNVESWTESEGTSSSEQCEHNVESRALNVMGRDQSGEKVSLFLEHWNLQRWL